MSAYLKEIAIDVWKVVSWPLFSQTRNNRLFWVGLMAIAILTNTISLDSFLDVFFLVISSSLFGYEWSAWWHRVDEEPNGSWYKESDIDQLMFERDEAQADVAELRAQISVLIDELEQLRA